MSQEDIDVKRPEETQMILNEIRNLQMQISKLQEDVEIIMEDQSKTQNLIKGGSQPNQQIKIVSEKGGPGCLPVAKIMKEARNGQLHQGITSKEAEEILEKEGFQRSRQSVLNILEKIADEFPNYEVRKGDRSKATALYFDK